MRAIIFFLLVVLPGITLAQKQLLLMNGEDVVLRLNPGDEIVLRLKNSKHVRTSYVNNIFETAVMVHMDTISFDKIDRIYFRHIKFINLIGGAFVVGGVGLFAIDQFNEVVVHGEKASLDGWVSTTSISGVVVGVPLMLINRKSQKINRRYRLMMVKKGSPFYQEAPKQFVVPDN